MQITIELRPDEQAAVDAHVALQQAAGESGLTAEALLTRMVLKLVRGWADVAARQREVSDETIAREALRGADRTQRAAVLDILNLEERDGQLIRRREERDLDA